MNVICSAKFGRRDATRFAFDVVKPALKRGATLDCRYRGKATLVTAKALDWKRGPTFDRRYRGKATLITEKALDWKPGSTLDCRYRGKATLVTAKALDWKRGPTFDRRYRGKAPPVTEKALDWKRGATLDCRYRGKATLITEEALDWKRAPTFDCRYRWQELQPVGGVRSPCRWMRINILNQTNGSARVHCVCGHYARVRCINGDRLSALADYERSTAIHRRVSVQDGSVVASRRLNRKASHRIR